MTTSGFLSDLMATLDSLISVRVPDQAQRSMRVALQVELIGNEIRLLFPQCNPARSLEDLDRQLESVAADQLAIIRTRCLFYACQDLITLLSRKQIRGSAIAREEAVLYVQDRLQRDDFRRIAIFDPGKGASFKTYIWQVIGNLLIDFARAHQRQDRKLVRGRDTAADQSPDALVQTQSVPNEGCLTEGQMHVLVATLLADESAGGGSTHHLREQLRRHVQLSSKERLFLKSLFQYDMSIDEVRQLPGFTMGKNEAYRFYYRLMEKLLECFKDAGVLAAMRGLISDADTRVTLSIEGRQVRTEVSRIYYVKVRDTGSARRHAACDG